MSLGNQAHLLTKENSMMKNIGNMDRILRVALGLLLISLAWMGIIGIWGWLGVALLLTAAIGFCPAYSFSGVNTCQRNEL